MKEAPYSSQSLCTFPSPGVACNNIYQLDNKGWSSERIPHPHQSLAGCSVNRRRRRHIGGSLSTPFSSGRALPSKWEDAERWICSPAIGYFANTNTNEAHDTRPKSKSGPIVVPPPSGSGYCNGISSSSPSSSTVQQFGNGRFSRNVLVNSPFSTGVLMPHKFGVSYSNGGVGHFGGVQVNVSRSISMPGWPDLVSESSFPSPRDEKLDDDMNEPEDNTVGRVTSKRDMATQMSPNCSQSSSPRNRMSSPPEPAQDEHPGAVQIREVQVDKRATTVGWSKQKGLPEDIDGSFDQNVMNMQHSSCWDISEVASDFSKLQREEAKITAWENLQKAKAEAEIRKLEMKLEKTKAASMGKILKRLKKAEFKAQEMRKRSSNMSPNPKTCDSNKIRESHTHSKSATSLWSWFTCRLF